MIANIWPGFGPGTFALPRQRYDLDYDEAITAAAAAPNLCQGFSVLLDDSFWTNYKEYLVRNFNRHTAKCRLIYARGYSYVLNELNASSILSLTGEKRIHIMKALATLSKYLGYYDEWKNIIQRYQLKWSNENTVETFNNVMMIDEQNYSSMIEWLKNCYSKLRSSYGNILLFNTLTGLRPDEACKAIEIIQTEEDNYVRKDLMILEHYKFPDIFIRRTKKAYISILTDSILDLVKQSANCGYNALRLAVKRKKLDMNMAYCRKIFATYLRTHGVEQEIIDLLQGRAPKSVFARHYFKPNFTDEKQKVTVCLENLCREIKSE
jgi:Archaeal phage integrase